MGYAAKVGRGGSTARITFVSPQNELYMQDERGGIKVSEERVFFSFMFRFKSLSLHLLSHYYPFSIDPYLFIFKRQEGGGREVWTLIHSRHAILNLNPLFASPLSPSDQT